MIKNAMAGAITLCGVGLCMIGGAQLLQRTNVAQAASEAIPAAAAAVAATTNAQVAPTVVWYGSDQAGMGGSSATWTIFYRAWSDGKVEYIIRSSPNTDHGGCGELRVFDGCSGAWRTLVDPAQGYRAAADVNSDQKVDGADLASVLSNWGDAPRVPFPPSDCPLNLINP